MSLSPNKRKRSASSDAKQQPSMSRVRLKDVVSPESESSAGPSEYFYSPGARTPTRDETFYLEDGSCILLVDNTLFNVHRTILSKDGSLFSTLLSLPQGQVDVEGRSDERPIVLLGDSAEEFRHFLPPELKAISSTEADVDALVDIARVSNKYAFKSLETWALDAVHDFVTRKPSPSSPPFLPPTSIALPPTDPDPGKVDADPNNARSTALLSRLIQTAHMCHHDRLLESMILLMKPLMVASLQYAHLAMRLADELNIRALRGCAYLEVMHKTSLASPVGTDTTPRPAAATLPLTPAQQLRLLAGYYRLTRTWETLRATAPHFEHASACGATWHQAGCSQSFNEFWREKTRGDGVLALGMADVIGRLRQIQRDFDRWGTAAYMHHDCRMSARKSIVEAGKKIEETLPDYFSERLLE
ncbi:hypothetical protein BD626DRAFT_549597 [Schizophyllum amplum]|uniref:BTB domain-containing protein n=1 Tax=Schizophyllum amplum TaxID=97359 RepID=A0A550C743_9AGAR|nr:hypothetical protein BD626DRAFT_549597 [Auriculariopsis ampla]